MSDHGFAARRSRERLGPDFPARPVLSREVPCSGLVVIDRDGGALRAARRLRTDIRSMFRAVLPNAPAPDPCLLLLFETPQRLAVTDWPNALPVMTGSGWTLKSFSDAVSQTAPPRGAEARHIDIWWAGAPHRLALDGLERVSLATLWDMPDVVVHRLPPPRPPKQLWGEASPPGARAVTPGRAALPFGPNEEGVFADTARRIASLDERTTLRSIGHQIRDRLLGRRAVGEGNEAADREPGVLTNLAGWLLWHTPLGVPLARQFAARMKLVERLMAAGDVDSALRLALKLSNADEEEAKRKAYPTRLPGMRMGLDFQIGAPGFAMPILGGGDYASLHARYVGMAERLEREGDYRRAAYVRSQLQGDHAAAVRTLERGEMFRDAAKLALDAGLEPALAISMFFKAGDADMALALAKRADCFDQLAEESRRADPVFHAYVLRAWTDRLIVTGQVLRALQVTDPLAAGEVADVELLRWRRAWIDRALGEAADELPSELAARALLTGDWSDARVGQSDPFSLGFDAPNAAATGLQWLAAQVEQGQGEMLQQFAATLLRLADAGTEQSSFWTIAAPPVVETLARALIASASVLGSREMQDLRALLVRAELRVLALDIGKLKLSHMARSGSDFTWTLPPPEATQSPVRHACLLHDGRIALWRASGIMQWLDPTGALRWQGAVSEIVGLVPIGGSADIIVVQADRDGGHRLSRFASRSRSFHPIGTTDLVAWHDLTSDGQWMVQIGGQIGALDLVKLCAPVPEIAFLWSCSLTENLEVCAFYRHPKSPAWITRDRTEARRDVTELWVLQQGRTLKTSLCGPAPTYVGVDARDVPLWFWANESYPDIRLFHNRSGVLPIVAWSEIEEHKLTTSMAARMREGSYIPLRIISCDGHRARVGLEARQTSLSVAFDNQTRKLNIAHDAAAAPTCLARGERIVAHRAGYHPSDQSSILLLADAHGRLIVADLSTQRVRLF